MNREELRERMISVPFSFSMRSFVWVNIWTASSNCWNEVYSVPEAGIGMLVSSEI